MSSGMYVALSGQLALERRMETIANNVANMNTAGYRAEGVRFDSVLSRAGGIATKAEEAATWAAVREAVCADRASLYMAGWHGDDWLPDAAPGGCGTTHCLAGWAQALSPDPEIRRLDPAVAGSRLLPRHAYLFFASDADALAALGLTNDAADAAQE